MVKKSYKNSKSKSKNTARGGSGAGKNTNRSGAGTPKKGRRHDGPERTHKPKNTITTNLYGAHAVREAWLNPDRTVKALYITDSALGSFQDYIDQARNAGLPRPAPNVVEKSALDKMCPREAVHQGIAMDAGGVPEMSVQDFIIKTHAQDSALFLMLDQVTDPHNVGAILRSASAFGADGVIMQRKHAPDLTGVLAKTACGAVDHIDVAYETNLSRTIEELQTAGFFVYGLDERGTQNIGDLKSGGKSVLVLGAEGPGLRRLVREHCDALVRLPTGGAIGSLNVSNAAAVALYAMLNG